MRGAFVKISSGWSKGLKILTPDGLDTRPTRERVRQSALNMLQPWIHESRVLDLFAGSGAVGIELTSRGGAGAAFVEKAPAAFKCLESNLKATLERAKSQSIELHQWRAFNQSVKQFVGEASENSYDLIWADPPYEQASQFLTECASGIVNILASGGVFALESGVEPGIILSQVFDANVLKLIKQRTYGVTLISIWQKA
jgi:16S rRNA (guanine966-N2)-methyltransferase